MKNIAAVFFLFILTIFNNKIFAQEKTASHPGRNSVSVNIHTVNGTIKEQKSGEVLIGATVRLLEVSKSATVSNAYGFYSISAPEGTYTLIAAFAGYKPDSIKIILNKNISQVVELVQRNTQ